MPTDTASTARRACVGALVHGFVDWTVENGLQDDVAAHVGPETRLLLEKPPLPVNWVDETDFDQLVVGLARATDRETVRRMGYETTRDANGVVVRPMLKAVLALFGATPAAIFGNMHLLVPFVVRGVEAAWTPEGTTGGTFELRLVSPAPPEAFVPFEGAFLFIFDLCGVTGTIGRCQPAPDGLSAHYAVSWEA